MKYLRCLVMGLTLLGFASLDTAEGAPALKRKKNSANTTPPTTNGQATNGFDGDVFTGLLVPKDLLAKLTLTDDQKSDLETIQKEFADKMKDVIAQAKEDAAKNTGGNTPAAKGKGKGKGAATKTPSAPGLTEAISLRNDCEDKVYKLLDDPQQKTWLDYKAKKGEGLLNGANTASTKTTPKK